MYQKSFFYFQVCYISSVPQLIQYCTTWCPNGTVKHSKRLSAAVSWKGQASMNEVLSIIIILWSHHRVIELTGENPIPVIESVNTRKRQLIMIVLTICYRRYKIVLQVFDCYQTWQIPRLDRAFVLTYRMAIPIYVIRKYSIPIRVIILMNHWWKPMTP